MRDHKGEIRPQDDYDGAFRRPIFSTAEVLARLERLYRKLDEEGWHVNANTIALAIEKIKSLAS